MDIQDMNVLYFDDKSKEWYNIAKAKIRRFGMRIFTKYDGNYIAFVNHPEKSLIVLISRTGEDVSMSALVECE